VDLTSILKRLPKTQRWLKRLEWFFWGIYLLGVFWYFYKFLCLDVISCGWNVLANQYWVLGIKLAIAVMSSVYCIRTAVVYLNHFPQKDRHKEFFFSLVVLNLSYISTAFLFDNFVNNDLINPDFGPYFLQVVLFLLTLTLFLSDFHVWENSPRFVQIRIAMAFFPLVLILINPLYALVISIPLISLGVFWAEPKSA
jgi:hypothetical protein